MARPTFFRVSTEALLHRRTGHGGRKGVGGGRLQPLQLQTIFTGKALMIRAKVHVGKTFYKVVKARLVVYLICQTRVRSNDSSYSVSERAYILF